MPGNDPPPVKTKTALVNGDPVETRFVRALRFVLDAEAGEAYRAEAQAELEAALPGCSVSVDLET